MAKKTSEYPAKQKKINEAIESQVFQHSYLIYGEETYLRNQNKDKLKKALLGSGDAMNLQYYSGKNLNPGEIIDMAETLPFFAERRVIVIEDSGFFKDGCKELSAYLKNPAETVYFIFVETDIDKRKDMYKAVHNNGFDIECDVQNEQTLIKWIAFKLGKENFKITSEDAKFFLERVGTDMGNAANELEKLVCYAQGRNVITRNDIEAVCANWLSNQIFVMMDAMVEHNQQKAMQLYYDLLALKEPPQRIQALIFRQFNLMMQVKEMHDNHRDNGSIASAVGLMPFIVGKYINWAKNYTMQDLKNNLAMIIENDEAVKKGKLNDVISVEMILVKCSARV